MSENIDYKSLYELAMIKNVQLTEQNKHLTETLAKYNTLYVAKAKFIDVKNSLIKLTNHFNEGARVNIALVANDLGELCELFSKAFK